MSIILRDYQDRAIEALRDLYRKGKRAPLLVSPTGSGKNTILCHMLAQSARKGRRALFCVHRREIIQDLRQRLRAEGVDPGIICASLDRGDANSPVQLATIGTLAKRPDKIPKADFLAIDEAHRAVTDQYKTLCRHPNLIHAQRCGTTATPARGDGSPLRDAFDSLYVAATIRDLTDRGLLVPVETIAPDVPQNGDLARHPIEAWQRHGIEKTVAGGSDIVRERIRRLEALAKGTANEHEADTAARLLEDIRARHQIADVERRRPTVIFAADRASAHSIADGLRELGVRVGVLTGVTSNGERTRIVEAFRCGEIEVLVNIFVAIEGFDVPPVEVVILGRSCSSSCLYVQAAGRALRPSPGKTHATLVDLAGACHIHGLVDDERPMTLDGGVGRARTDLTRCEDCDRWFRGDACPICRPRLKQMSLGLEKAVTGDEIRAITSTARRLCAPRDPITETKDWTFWQELRAERGYSEAWPFMQFKAKYGIWPFWLEATGS